MAAAASVLATVVSGVFAAALLRRYLGGGRRNGALLAWGASLSMFCIASATLAAGALVGWSTATFRTFYLFGAVLNVPWLAQGSVQINGGDRRVLRASATALLVVGVLALLLVLGAEDTPAPVFGAGAGLAVGWAVLLLAGGEREVVGARSLGLVWGFTVVAAGVVLTADLAPLPATSFPEGSELFGAGPRSFAFAGNTVGATLVVVSAVASAVAHGWRTAPDEEVARARAVGGGSLVGYLHRAVETVLVVVRGRRRPGGHLLAGNLLIALGVLLAGAGGAFAFLGDTAAKAVGLGLGATVMYLGFARTTRPTP